MNAGQTPDPVRWTRLLAELQTADARRTWLSNKNLSDEPETKVTEILWSSLRNCGTAQASHRLRTSQ